MACHIQNLRTVSGKRSQHTIFLLSCAVMFVEMQAACGDLCSRLCCSHWEVCVIRRTMFVVSITAVAAALFAHVAMADGPDISISVNGKSISQDEIVAITSITAVLLAPCVGLVAMVIAKHYKVLGALMLVIVVTIILSVVTLHFQTLSTTFAGFSRLSSPTWSFWNLTTAWELFRGTLVVFDAMWVQRAAFFLTRTFERWKKCLGVSFSCLRLEVWGDHSCWGGADDYQKSFLPDSRSFFFFDRHVQW